MDMPKEDFQWVRQAVAARGVECTPDELQAILAEAAAEPLILVDEPGLVDLIRCIRRHRDHP